MKKTYFFLAALIVISGTIPSYAATVDGICGFATQNGGTTGGAGGEVVTVTNLADFMTAVRDADPTPRTVYINAPELNSGDDKGMQVKLGSNKTIIGCGSGTFMNGVLLGINAKSNIIIRNLKFTMISITNTTDPSVYDPDGDEGRPQIIVNGGDCISIQSTSSNIWIDHCEFYQQDPAVQTNQDLYDGLIDIKNASQYITISWCYFRDHHKCHLVGSSDTDNYDRKTTFHHNYYNNIKERMPSYRFGTGHVFNNYFYKILNAGVNSRMEACLRVERNYFENSIDPIVAENSTLDGYWDLHDSVSGADNSNIYSGCSGNQPTASNCAFTPPYAYSSFLDAAADSKAIVLANAGIGKITTGCGAPPATLTRTRTRTQTPVVPTFTRTLTRTNTPAFTATLTATPQPTFTRTLTSTATMTASPVPAGYQEIQLENACSMEGIVESEHAGYTGTGYANLDNVIGSAITFSLMSASAQAVSLDFRYANGSTSNRSMSVAVNGAIQIASLSFPGTGAWTTWSVSTSVIMLAPGYNTITLASLIAEGAPNLDMVSFSSTTITDGNCVPAATETASNTNTPVPSVTPTASRTRTPSLTATATLTAYPVFSATRTSSATATSTSSELPTSSVSPTAIITNTPVSSVSQTRTATMTGTIAQPSLTATATLTAYPVFSSTRTAIMTGTAVPPSMTATATLTVTPLNTFTATATVSSTATITLTSTPLPTGTETFTRTFTGTATPTSSATATSTSSVSDTPTRTPSRTATVTVTATQTASSTPAATATATNVLTGVFAINNFSTYPNPYKTETGGIYLSFDVPVQAQNCALKVYSPAFRKVMSEPVGGVFYGHAITQASAQRFQNLSAGVYYAVLEGESQDGEKAASKPAVIIILK